VQISTYRFKQSYTLFMGRGDSAAEILFGHIGPRQPAEPSLLPDMIEIRGSSNVHSIGYDPVGNDAYAVLGNERRIYVWRDVPEDLYQSWLSSYSKGSFLHKEIKGRFVSERLDDPEQGADAELDKVA